MAKTDRRPLIVGESPSASGDRYWRFPLSGAPARVLCRCAGWPPEGEGKRLGDWTWALYRRARTVNVFERHADATPWSAPAARARAREIVVGYRPEVVVLLGRRVGEAFGIADSANWFEWVEWSSAAIGLSYRVVMIPHPSGRNLMMNDPANRARVGEVLREAESVYGRSA